MCNAEEILTRKKEKTKMFPVKRGRGRPRKRKFLPIRKTSTTTTPKADVPVSNQEADETSVGVEVKKRRGRPRKIRVENNGIRADGTKAVDTKVDDTKIDDTIDDAIAIVASVGRTEDLPVLDTSPQRNDETSEKIETCDAQPRQSKAEKVTRDCKTQMPEEHGNSILKTVWDSTLKRNFYASKPFTELEEKAIVQHVRIMAKRKRPYTEVLFKKLMGVVLRCLQRTALLNYDKRLPSKYWVTEFLQQNPRVEKCLVKSVDLKTYRIFCDDLKRLRRKSDIYTSMKSVFDYFLQKTSAGDKCKTGGAVVQHRGTDGVVVQHRGTDGAVVQHRGTDGAVVQHRGTADAVVQHHEVDISEDQAPDSGKQEPMQKDNQIDSEEELESFLDNPVNQSTLVKAMRAVKRGDSVQRSAYIYKIPESVLNKYIMVTRRPSNQYYSCSARLSKKHKGRKSRKKSSSVRGRAIPTRQVVEDADSSSEDSTSSASESSAMDIPLSIIKASDEIEIVVDPPSHSAEHAEPEIYDWDSLPKMTDFGQSEESDDKSETRSCDKPVPKTAGETLPETSHEPVPKTSLEGVPKTSDELLHKTSDELMPKTSDELLPKTSETSDELHVLPKTSDDLLPITSDELLPKTSDELLPKTSDCSLNESPIGTSCAQAYECEESDNEPESALKSKTKKSAKKGGFQVRYDRETLLDNAEERALVEHCSFMQFMGVPYTRNQFLKVYCGYMKLCGKYGLISTDPGSNQQYIHWRHYYTFRRKHPFLHKCFVSGYTAKVSYNGTLMKAAGSINFQPYFNRFMKEHGLDVEYPTTEMAPEEFLLKLSNCFLAEPVDMATMKRVIKTAQEMRKDKRCWGVQPGEPKTTLIYTELPEERQEVKTVTFGEDSAQPETARSAVSSNPQRHWRKPGEILRTPACPDADIDGEERAPVPVQLYAVKTAVSGGGWLPHSIRAQNLQPIPMPPSQRSPVPTDEQDVTGSSSQHRNEEVKTARGGDELAALSSRTTSVGVKAGGKKGYPVKTLDELTLDDLTEEVRNVMGRVPKKILAIENEHERLISLACILEKAKMNVESDKGTSVLDSSDEVSEEEAATSKKQTKLRKNAIQTINKKFSFIRKYGRVKKPPSGAGMNCYVGRVPSFWKGNNLGSVDEDTLPHAGRLYEFLVKEGTLP